MQPVTAKMSAHIERTDATRIAAAIQAAGLAASTDRPGLDTIWLRIEDNSWTFVATDSYMLVKIDVETVTSSHTDNHQTLVDAKWFMATTKQFLKKNNPGFNITFDIEQSTITIDNGETTASNKTPEYQYPNWQTLFQLTYETDQPHQRTGYNPDFMARLMKSATTIGGDQPMIIEQLDPLKPGHFTRTNEQTNWNAILMPVRNFK
jgi:hypothetical protein